MTNLVSDVLLPRLRTGLLLADRWATVLAASGGVTVTVSGDDGDDGDDDQSNVCGASYAKDVSDDDEVSDDEDDNGDMGEIGTASTMSSGGIDGIVTVVYRNGAVVVPIVVTVGCGSNVVCDVAAAGGISNGDAPDTATDGEGNAIRFVRRCCGSRSTQRSARRYLIQRPQGRAPSHLDL